MTEELCAPCGPHCEVPVGVGGGASRRGVLEDGDTLGRVWRRRLSGGLAKGPDGGSGHRADGIGLYIVLGEEGGIGVATSKEIPEETHAISGFGIEEIKNKERKMKKKKKKRDEKRKSRSTTTTNKSDLRRWGEKITQSSDRQPSFLYF